MSYSPLPRGEGWLRPLLLKRNQFHSAPVSEDGYGAVPLYGGQYNGQYTCQYNGQYSGQYKSKYNGQNNSKYNGRYSGQHNGTGANTIASTLANTMANTVANTGANTMARTIASTMAGTIASTMAGTMASAMANTTHSPEAIPLETLVKHSPELLGTQHAENGVLSTEKQHPFPCPHRMGLGAGATRGPHGGPTGPAR